MLLKRTATWIFRIAKVFRYQSKDKGLAQNIYGWYQDRKRLSRYCWLLRPCSRGINIHSIKTDESSGIETYWHKRLESKRMQGEWFALKPDDIKAFQRRHKIVQKFMDIKRKTTETYDKIAPGYSAGHFVHFWIEEFDFYKSIINGKKVVDLGCGAGRDAAVFVESGFDYTGIDASEGMLEVANRRVPKGKFQKMDFSKTNFQHGEFDGFWAAASFLHIPKKDVAGVLKEAKRITKNGGVGFISVKEKKGVDEGMIEENKYGGISRYFSFYTQDEFKNLLEQNGFSVVRMSTHTEDDERKTNWLCYFVKVQN